MERTLSPLGALAAIMALLALVMSAVALQRDGAVALGDSTAGDPDAGADVVSVADAAPTPVSLTEFAIGPDPVVAPPGGTLSVRNDGSLPHNLVVRGFEDSLRTADLEIAATEELDLTGLDPGEYPIFCDIVGHESAGMVATLVIDPDAEQPGEAIADVGSTDSDVGSDGAVDGSQLTGIEKAEWLRANYEASVSQFPAETAVMGSQRMEPEILDDGTKVFELTLSKFEWEVAPGEWVTGTGYNEQVPGPWIHTEVGDTVTIRVINELEDEATTLHPHGIFLHPFETDGVGMISMDPIMPGETWEETFVTQEVSVGMYHGHDNGVHQVPDGAFGAFTVGQLPLPPIADNVVQEHVMVLNDAGTIGLTLNGKSFPATEPYVLTQGEQAILHFYNEGLAPHPMHLHNNPMLVIAKDGYPLQQPIVMDTVNVAPGERYSVVIFAEVPGVWVFHCHILTHVERSDGSVFGMFTALIVDPSDDPTINDDLGQRLGRGDGTTFPGGPNGLTTGQPAAEAEPEEDAEA